MLTPKHRTRSLLCALALLAQGTGALAQTPQTKDKAAPAPDADVMIFRTGPGVPPPPGEPGLFKQEIFGGQGLMENLNFNFNFMSPELSFESKTVKGAPYSAEAVTESTQTLGDGNRITHKTTANIYRDGEGRTRREQSLTNIGPWATADEPAQTIFINDPVAGVNYVLDARTKTARKASYSFSFSHDGKGVAPPLPFTFKRGGNHGDAPAVIEQIERVRVLAPPAAPGAPEELTALRVPLAPPAPGELRRGMAVKQVQPVYPPVARAAGAQGPVRVKIVIGDTGEVVSAQAVSGHPLLQQAAVDAARQWRFEPAQADGKLVKVNGTLAFNFVLADKGDGPQQTTLMLTAEGAPRIHGGPSPLPPVKESLGKQTIEGVEAEGTRTTVTIPAGTIGNERPILIVSERWYSPELQTVVMTRRSDPRSGETTYRLTNINRAEPAHALFEVPPGYTLKEGGPLRQMRIFTKPDGDDKKQ